jgi:hypothetical protein
MRYRREDDRRVRRKAVKAGAGNVRTARVGSLESRTAVRVGVVAISTQASPSPGPEWVDFRQLSTGCLTTLAFGRWWVGPAAHALPAGG